MNVYVVSKECIMFEGEDEISDLTDNLKVFQTVKDAIEFCTNYDVMAEHKSLDHLDTQSMWKNFWLAGDGKLILQMGSDWITKSEDKTTVTFYIEEMELE